MGRGAVFKADSFVSSLELGTFTLNFPYLSAFYPTSLDR
jgi:hypothetical protein